MPFPKDISVREGVLALFGAVWPRLPAAIARAAELGADWYAVSTPFVERVGGRIVAHVGVLEMPLRVDGRDVVVAGVHAVCTHPDARGRGHIRAALERALEYVDARYATALLWSEKVSLYERFGFRVLPEHTSELRVRPGPKRPIRRLDLGTLADRELLRRMLFERAPVSSRLGTRDPGWHFTIDLSLWQGGERKLWWCDAFEAVIAAEREGDVLRIHDVVARRIPDAAAFAACFGAQRVELLISPDLVTKEPVIARPSEIEDVLMVRGDFPSLDEPFALSPLTRC